jgi:hypothetical protein
VLPGLGLYLLWRYPGIWRPGRHWLVWGGALMLPLLLYLYLPLTALMGRGDLEGAYVNTWAGFWHHVLAQGYTGFFGDNPLAVERSGMAWFTLFREQLGWPGLILAGLGMIRGLTGPRRAEWLVILATFLLTLTFTLLYRVADAPVFAIPAYMMLAVFAGNGLVGIGDWGLGIGYWILGSGEPPNLPLSHSPNLQYLISNLLTLILLALILLPLGRGEGVNRAGDWAVHDYAVSMATVDFPPGSQVVGLRGQMTALAYMQQAEGMAPNATPVAVDDPDARRAFVIAGVEAGQPLFLTQEVAGMGERFSFSGHGPLVRVWPRGAAQPGQPSLPLSVALLDEGLRITGYDLFWLQQAGGPALQLHLYWLPVEPVEPTLKLSLRLQHPDGSPLIGPDGAAMVEDPFPLRQVALSPEWLPGEVVRDVHILPGIGLAGEGEDLQLLVIVYDAATGSEFGRFPINLPPK